MFTVLAIITLVAFLYFAAEHLFKAAAVVILLAALHYGAFHGLQALGFSPEKEVAALQVKAKTLIQNAKGGY